MPRLSIGRSVRTLRRARRWRQFDLARAVGVSTSVVSRVERDLVDGLTVGTLRRCLPVLDGYLAVEARWHGTDLAVLADSRHAALQDWAATRLRTTAWDARAEISFNHFGDRGRYDLLAFHAAQRIVLAVEVKTVLTDLQDTLGRLDVKTRLAPSVAAELGWNPVVVVPMLVIGAGRTAERRIAEHPALFGRFALRGRAGLVWLRRPTEPLPSGILLLVRPPDSRQVTAARREVPLDRQILAR